MAASASKVTPASPRAAAMPTSGIQYSGPIRPRCAHLLTAEAEMSCPAALKSSDTASSEGHRSKTARGVSNMGESLGPHVLNVKAILSYDMAALNREDAGMAGRISDTEEKDAFIARVRAARVARFDKQKPMITILGLDQGTYKQYETRTPLPWRLIPKFCAATGVDIEWLLTGEGKGPNVIPIVRDQKSKIPEKPSRRRVA